MPKPSVTVLIPTYNRAQFLPECLDSLLGQTLPPAEIVVVNDGSSDNTGLVVAPYKGKIEYIETENRGKSAALNTAMSRVNGDSVWIFDDDNVAIPDALERLTRALEERPDCGFSYGPHYISRTRPEDGRIEAERVLQIPNVAEEEIFIRLLETCFLGGAGILVRTKCYREVGPFREDLIRSQDYEMALRLSRRYRGVRVDGPTFHYRQHEGPRGSSLDPFSADKKTQKWREYGGKFFRELRLELDLREYLPRGVDRAALSPTDARRAYLQRMTIMASQGLYDEMIEDLRLALAQEVDSPGLSEPERLVVTRATSYAPTGDTLFTEPTILTNVKKACLASALGREVHLEFLRGIYWRAHYALTHRSFGHAIRFLKGFIWCAGLGGTVRALKYKLTQRSEVNTASDPKC